MGEQARQLIERYIRPAPHRPTPDEAIVMPSGVKVWAIIGHLRSVDGDVGRVAKGYDVPEDAVRAAMAYYQQHRTLIDNRLEANVTPRARLVQVELWTAAERLLHEPRGRTPWVRFIRDYPP